MKKLALVIVMMFICSAVFAQSFPRLPFGTQQPDMSGMEKKSEASADKKSVIEKTVYYDKAGKEYSFFSMTISKENLEETKIRLQENIVILEDPVKIKESKDAIEKQIADIDAKLELVK
jgi:hypothetical protein